MTITRARRTASSSWSPRGEPMPRLRAADPPDRAPRGAGRGDDDDGCHALVDEAASRRGRDPASGARSRPIQAAPPSTQGARAVESRAPPSGSADDAISRMSSHGALPDRAGRDGGHRLHRHRRPPGRWATSGPCGRVSSSGTSPPGVDRPDPRDRRACSVPSPRGPRPSRPSGPCWPRVSGPRCEEARRTPERCLPAAVTSERHRRSSGHAPRARRDAGCRSRRDLMTMAHRPADVIDVPDDVDGRVRAAGRARPGPGARSRPRPR